MAIVSLTGMLVATTARAAMIRDFATTQRVSSFSSCGRAAERSCPLQDCGSTTLRQLGRHDGEQPAAVRSDPCGGQRSDRKSVPPRSATLRSIALAHRLESTRPGPRPPLPNQARARSALPPEPAAFFSWPGALRVHRCRFDGFARDFLRLLQPDAGPSFHVQDYDQSIGLPIP